MFQPIPKIPVNIIAGFLGAGKSTVVQHLLKTKPHHEHWAVIVNEFGAVGIDAAMMEEQGDIAIASVSGGCICCTGSLELQQAVIKILRQEKPDRILIEPSGLGQIEKVIDMLQEGSLGETLDLRTQFCLIDPNQTTPKSIAQSLLHQDLIQVADVLVFTKQDQKNTQNDQAWLEFIDNLYPQKEAVLYIQNGQLPLEALDWVHHNQTTAKLSLKPHSHHHSKDETC